jgi:phosphatidylglycerol---prolipoprotein diacylglyceryl transferase
MALALPAAHRAPWMRPVLFHIGPLEVDAWGVMAAVATGAGWLVLRSELRRLTGNGEVALSLVLAAVIGGLIGARLYYLVEHAGQVSALGSLGSVGFTWYGGFLGGAVAVLAVAYRRKVPIPALLGAMAPALALAYAFARVGCQLAGDGTYGVPSHLPWAMSYPHGVVPTDERVHPTPVYETLASLAIFAVLWRLRTRVAPVRLFALYLALSGLERFLVEFVRRNEHVWLGLTQPQLWAAVLAALGAAILVGPGLGRVRVGAARP